MFQVDNSGRGNCMYYAYSISMMYFLRARNDNATNESVFNKFKLSEEQKARLRPLLNENRDRPFNKNEIKGIIEPILGTASRSVAAQHTREMFLNNPQATALFAAAQYGLQHFVLQAQRDYHPILADIANDFDDDDYREAELFRVPGMLDSLSDFGLQISHDIVERFNTKWQARIKDETEKFAASKSPTIKRHGIKKYLAMSKSSLLLDEISQATLHFFTANENQQLDSYIARLNTEFVWGTEETMMELHQVIQGQHKIYRTVETEKGLERKAQWVFETEIPLVIHQDDESPDYATALPALILNNIGNGHWTSIIPEHIFNPANQSPDAQSSLKRSIEQHGKEFKDHQEQEDRKFAQELSEKDLLIHQKRELQEANDAKLAKQLQNEADQEAKDAQLAHQLQNKPDQEANDAKLAQQLQAKEDRAASQPKPSQAKAKAQEQAKALADEALAKAQSKAAADAHGKGTHVIQMNQNCAEVMLMKASALLGTPILFQYEKNVSDTQVDLGPAFVYSPDAEKRVWYSGNSQQNLERDLETLDKSKLYFLRTGTNDGAGHWQNLYYDNAEAGWMIYSTETNNYQLTSQKVLTQKGLSLLTPYGKWGTEKGQHLFLLVEASKQNLNNACNFVYDYRTLGENEAIKFAFNQINQARNIIVAAINAPANKKPAQAPIDSKADEQAKADAVAAAAKAWAEGKARAEANDRVNAQARADAQAKAAADAQAKAAADAQAKAAADAQAKAAANAQAKAAANIQGKNTQEIQMNQNCTEVMLMKASALLGTPILFQYEKNVSDTQVDLEFAFVHSPYGQKKYWFNGDSQQDLERDLEKLDKTKLYFLRTGTNGGEGHWQNLYYDNAKAGWMIYSTETNNYQLTSQKVLTQKGLSLLTPNGKWGTEKGQHLFLLVEASKQNLNNACNFVYDHRTVGEKEAIRFALDQVNYSRRIIVAANNAPVDKRPAQAPIALKADAQAKAAADAQAKAAADAQAKAAAEAQAKAADAQAKATADAQAKATADAQAKATADAQAKAAADAQAKAAADAQAKAADAQAKAAADAQAKAAADAQAKAAADAQAKAAADAQAKAAADAQAKATADAQAKAAADAQAKADLVAVGLKAWTDAKARGEANDRADAQAKPKADAQAKSDAKSREQLLEEFRKAREVQIKQEQAKDEARVKMKLEEAQRKVAPAKLNFEEQLKLLREKIQNLTARKNKASGDDLRKLGEAEYAATDLLNNLTAAASVYFANPSKASFLNFKTNCEGHIAVARPVLESHRGMKQLLGNLALAVAGLGILYLIAATINKMATGNFLFFSTESKQVVDSIEESVNKAAPSA